MVKVIFDDGTRNYMPVIVEIPSLALDSVPVCTCRRISSSFILVVNHNHTLCTASSLSNKFFNISATHI